MPTPPNHDKRRGAPSKFTEALAAEICARIAEGESLVSICEQQDMPSYGTVMRWVGENDTFRESYARAREAQADFLAEEIIDLADTCREGKKRTEKGDGSVEIVTGDMVERTRLQIDARKWRAAHLAPKKYGDHQRVEHASDEEHPVQVVIHHVGSKPPES